MGGGGGMGQERWVCTTQERNTAVYKIPFPFSDLFCLFLTLYINTILLSHITVGFSSHLLLFLHGGGWPHPPHPHSLFFSKQCTGKQFVPSTLRKTFWLCQELKINLSWSANFRFRAVHLWTEKRVKFSLNLAMFVRTEIDYSHHPSSMHSLSLFEILVACIKAGLILLTYSLFRG